MTATGTDVAIQYRFDHAVVVVARLEAAIADYTGLGFTVVVGGRHPQVGTHNAVIPFADGTYIELIAPERAAVLRRLRHLKAAGRLDEMAEGLSWMEQRLMARAAAGQGLADLALLPKNMGEVLAEVRARGLAMDGPQPGCRTRPDGQLVSWELGFARTLDLPFLCADVTSRALRVPTGESTRHLNGAMGIQCVIVATDDLNRSAHRYARLLGRGPLACRLGRWPSRAVRFGLERGEIVLAEPMKRDSPLGSRLAIRGAGPCLLRLALPSTREARRLDPTRACGAWIELGSPG